MNLEGSLNNNLEAAVTSAQKHRTRPVYSETMAYWEELLAHARRAKNGLQGADAAVAEQLIARLDAEIMMRKA
jgi:hypothetical protein